MMDILSGAVRLVVDVRQTLPTSPSAVRLFEIFDGRARRHLIDANGAMIQTFPSELTELQRTLLDLLGVPEDRYR